MSMCLFARFPETHKDRIETRSKWGKKNDLTREEAQMGRIRREHVGGTARGFRGAERGPHHQMPRKRVFRPNKLKRTRNGKRGTPGSGSSGASVLELTTAMRTGGDDCGSNRRSR